MNYVCLIGKILTEPKQSFFQDDLTKTQLWVKFPQSRQSKFIDLASLSIWGDLAYEVIKYYQVNDYILVEGFLNIQPNNNPNNYKNEYIEISVFKLYPFILTSKILSRDSFYAF